MSQPNSARLRKARKEGIRPADVDQLLEVIRVLDRGVVEISMHIYQVPRRERALLREQHRRLHEAIRERLPDFVKKAGLDV